MATIKSFTDLSQSKTLSKILPLESADMHWKLGVIDTIVIDDNGDFRKYRSIPAWSLAALLELLPKRLEIMDDVYELGVYFYGLYYWNIFNGNLCFEFKDKDNLVDACVAMIEKLHEQNIL